MKISTRDKRILLMFLGVFFLAAAYLFVYKPQMETVAMLESENETLQIRLNELVAMSNDRAFYEDEIRRMSAEIRNYCEAFPAAIKEEDGILLANKMEKKMDIQISNVGLGEKELLSTIDGGAETPQEVVPDQTLMERSGQKTMDQINEIEGTNEQLAVGTVDEVRNPEQDITEFLYDVTWNPALYRNQNTLKFVTNYKGLKRAVKYINNQTGRMTVDNVSATFDSETGNLSGTMVVNLYSMSNTGTTYQTPDAGNVKHGTKNIFGTIEKPVKKKASNDSE